MTPRLANAGGLPLIGAALAALLVALASSRSPLLTITAFAALLLIIFVLTQPQAILMIMLAAFPWEGMLDFPTHTLTVIKILGFLLVVSVTLSSIGQGTTLRAPPAVVAGALFVLIAAISLIVSADIAAGYNQLLRYTLFVGFFFIAVQLLDTKERLLRAIRVLIASLGIAAIYGLVAFLSGNAARAEGPITEPLEFGYMLAVFIPLCVYLILEDKSLRWLWIPCLSAMLAATLATLARGAFVGLIVMLIWAVLTRRIRLGGLLVSTIGIFALVSLGYSLYGPVINERVEQKQVVAEKNSEFRVVLWKGALRMSMDHPVLGVGTGRFGIESTRYILDNPIVQVNPQAHNAYVEVLAESGPFALAAFLAVLGISWTTLARTRRASRIDENRPRERLANALQAALLVAIVGAVFLSEQVASPIWVICAFAAVMPLAFGSSHLAPRRPG